MIVLAADFHVEESWSHKLVDVLPAVRFDADVIVNGKGDHAPRVGRVRVASRTGNAGHQAHHIREENKKEEGADNREELSPVVADRRLTKVAKRLDHDFEYVS